MRGIAVCATILAALAITDAHFSSQLLASVKADAIRNDASLFSYAAKLTSANTIAASEVDMVEQALNSRYMQWGAVGVMLMLFVWIVMRHQPAQERQRDVERKEERESFLSSLRERDSQYLSSLKDRDSQYLGTLADIRRSVEKHSDQHHVAKENLSNAVNQLTAEIRKSH